MSRRIRLRREGLYYLCVLAFIIGGAALRQVNLLVILAGLVVAPLIFNWRLVAATLRELKVRRKLPRRISAGDVLFVDLSIANTRRRLDSWYVMIEDTIMLEGVGPRDGRTTVETGFSHVPAGETRRESYRCHLQRRGRYRFGPLRMSSRFPLGLVQAETTIKIFDTLIVCPRIGRLSRGWRALIESERAGAERSQSQRGLVEGEFFGLRDFRPGDTRRWIHWRTSARRPALAVRQFERQRNRDVTLVVDLWLPNNPVEERLGNVELAVSLAATAVADLCKRGGSRLQIAVVGSSDRRQTATASQVFMHDVLEQLAIVEGGDGAGLSEMLATSLTVASGGSRTIVVSTRPQGACRLEESAAFRNYRRLSQELTRLSWLDVSSPEIEDLFQWSPDP